jgi:tungstate transport system permease protein
VPRRTRTSSLDLVASGVREALRLLLSGDREVLAVLWLSLQVSGTATALALLLGIPLGSLLALTRFPGRTLAVSAINTGMGVPPVVVGLVVTLLLWRSGPLGGWEILYTPAAIIVAQALIAAPIVAGITLAAVQNVPAAFRLQLLGLGASRLQMVWCVLREARLPMLAAVMAGFGGIISEIGASMMVGGNIKGQTRTLTTAMVLETGKGNFDVAIALALLLMVLIFLVNWLLTRLQQRRA